MFSLYSQEIKNIVSSYKFHIHMFADDIQIYFQYKNNSQINQLENFLNDIKIWASNNVLKLNEDKTKFLSFSTKRCPLHFSLNLPDKFYFETKFKNLRFLLDNKLNFNAQINKVCQVGYGLLKKL